MKNNIVVTKAKKSLELKNQSSNAIDVVTSVIDRLSSINAEIDAQVAEIEETQAKLRLTETSLTDTKFHNIKIISKFKELIED